MGDIFGTPTSNAYGAPINITSSSSQPSLMSSSTIVGTLNNPSTPIRIGGVNTTLGELKKALLTKSRNQTNPMNNRFNTANRALSTINNASEVSQIFSDNKINVASDGAGGITLSATPVGGRKSQKTKKRRRVRKQTGGFEYSSKSKRRRFSVTRSSSSPRSSQPRSSQPRSSQERSSYETQSSVPPKYRARGSKKTKI
jgi:hypothetical protein